MPIVSVIIPTYNRADSVPEAIDSVLRQSFQDLEVIVVDDGSSDDTERALGSFGDSRLRYLRQENSGVSVARNRGILAAKAKHIAFLDSDDVCMPNRLSLQLSSLRQTPDAGLVYGWYFVEGGENTRRLIMSCSRDTSLRELILGPVFHWSTTLIEKDWLLKVGLYDEKMRVGGDWDLSLRLLLEGCRMVCVAKPLSIVRHHSVSLTRNVRRHLESEFIVLDNAYRHSRMPVELHKIQGLAKAAQLIRVAGSAYLVQQPEIARSILERAIHLEPSLTGQNIEFLASRLVNYVTGLSRLDPNQTIREVISNLPGEGSLRRKLKREVLGQFHLVGAFEASQAGNHGRTRHHAIRAIGYRISWVRNRGLLSILIRSLIGDRLFSGLKSIGEPLTRT